MKIRCDNCFQEYEEDYGLCPHCGYAQGENTSEVYCLAPGTRITDRYIIGQTLGLGGFGITYKAWDVQLETLIAIKEYFPSGLVNRSAGEQNVFVVSDKRSDDFMNGRRRFLEEARNMAKFSQHHNIVNVFNYFEANNTAYIVMEYLDGMTLSQAVRTMGKPLSVKRCVSIAMDMCDALSAIHREKILHRDVSPDNIMLCQDGSVKLFDFGAARFSADEVPDEKLTVIIKPGFAPPEQYSQSARQDVRADIYALGATIYYALTGVKPEESTNRKIADTLQPPTDMVDGIPEYISNAIMRAMSLDVRFRFGNAEEFRSVFRKKILVPTVAAEQKKQRNRKALVVGAAALVALVLVVGICCFFVGRQPKTNPLAGELVIWYAAPEDSARRDSAMQMWDDLSQAFSQAHPAISLQVIGIPESVYSDQLEQAFASGQMPDVYMSNGMGVIVSCTSADESQSTGSVDDGPKEYIAGMILPVVYVNSSIGTVSDGNDCSVLQQASSQAGSAMVCDLQWQSLWERVYGQPQEGIDDALERFLSGEAMVYLGSTAEYVTVQEQMLQRGTGKPQVLLPMTGVANVECGLSFRCGNSQVKERADVFLKFLQSREGQDYLNIRNFPLYGNVPATEEAMTQFVSIYGKLAGVQDYLTQQGDVVFVESVSYGSLIHCH